MNSLLDQLGPRVVVDCGHIGVRCHEGRLVIGAEGLPTETQILTLEMGATLIKRLEATGRRVEMSICLSDTTRQLQHFEMRRELRQRLADRGIAPLLPPAYRAVLAAAGIAPETCRFSLQTQNSNLFSKILKQVKRDIRKPGSTPASIYHRYKAIFLNDADGDLFGFTTAFLLDPEPEIRALGGRWWMDAHYEPTARDLREAPLLRLKLMRLINLHSRASGILCPATYGGLLLSFDEAGQTHDHVAIYSRADDPYIGEKILRGVIASHVVSPDFGRNCLQVILPELGDNPELSLLNRDVLFGAHDLSFSRVMSRYEAAGLNPRCEACA